MRTLVVLDEVLPTLVHNAPVILLVHILEYRLLLRLHAARERRRGSAGPGPPKRTCTLSSRLAPPLRASDSLRSACAAASAAHNRDQRRTSACPVSRLPRLRAAASSRAAVSSMLL